jgi:hypothetical protein
MKKLSRTVGKRTYKHGQWFRATINGEECIGRISINSGNVFLCQEVHDGSKAPDKLGFLFSWTVGSGSDSGLKGHEVTNLKLLSRKPASFVKPMVLPSIGEYRAALVNNGETIRVGCTPVSRGLYLEVGRKAGWIE